MFNWKQRSDFTTRRGQRKRSIATNPRVLLLAWRRKIVIFVAGNERGASLSGQSLHVGDTSCISPCFTEKCVKRIYKPPFYSIRSKLRSSFLTPAHHAQEINRYVMIVRHDIDPSAMIVCHVTAVFAIVSSYCLNPNHCHLAHRHHRRRRHQYCLPSSH